jgi:hypothetical protein
LVETTIASEWRGELLSGIMVGQRPGQDQPPLSAGKNGRARPMEFKRLSSNDDRHGRKAAGNSQT